MKFILIAGKAGAGKTTLANMLSKRLESSKVLSFANPVKKIAYELGWDGNKDNAGRKLLQTIGDVGREYKETIWIELSLREINKEKYIIFDDLRYYNEYKYMKDNFRDIYTILVTCRSYNLDPSLSKHSSENDIVNKKDLYNYIVCNNRTLEHLDKIAEEILIRIK